MFKMTKQLTMHMYSNGSHFYGDLIIGYWIAANSIFFCLDAE